tara:strand:+ start:203 stop:535 length:333 start_codon:yes stop_codon:yes gene_type:complete
MFTYIIKNSNEDPVREIVADELFFASTPLTAIHPDATSYVRKIFVGVSLTPEGVARTWRDEELNKTDWIEAVPKHSFHSSIMGYRDSLRDWPSTEEFPSVQPTAPRGAYR